MYVCGPTVYDFTHIGNARAFIVADIIHRYLEYKGYNVTHVSNVTDIDDKTIKKAKETGVSLQKLGEKYTDAYLEDIAELNVKKPDVNPRATQHITEIIKLIQTLIDRGYAYQVDGDVYYDILKFENYGRLSGNKAEALKMGARIEVDPRKKNPADFALWKSEEQGESAWISPWGFGRPGWHVECSAMSTKYLGESFDIHMGGIDLIFPHHENEIAQSEAATGKPFVKYWLHNEWLTIDGKKMSKSLGNFITTRDATKKYGSQVVRFFLASVHYRSPVDFNNTNLRQAKSKLDTLLGTIKNFEALNEREDQTVENETILQEVEKAKQRFEEAMDDDFNTPLATSALLDLTKEINKFIESHTEMKTEAKRKIAETLRDLVEGVLGIETKTERLEQTKLVDDLLNLIIEIRQQMREGKDWQMTDKIRNKLQNIGITLEDTPKGTRWKIKV